MRAAEKAEEFVESALLRMHLRRVAQVPFADQASGVAGLFEAVGDRGFRERQARIFCRVVAGRDLLPFFVCLLSAAARIELVAESRLIAARQQPARVGEQYGPET